MNNLLEDRLVRARTLTGAVERFSLPTLYAALQEDRVTAFPALRSHQRHAWHAFLAQLASIALHRQTGGAVPESAAEWATALRSLTPDFPEDEPWCLVVEDPSKPAFLQCPAPLGLDAYRKPVLAPDDLDVLVTAKNHEVKQTIGLHGTPEDWLFALVDLQTMAGFLGAGNYGVARMNGGFSSRSCLGLAPADQGPGAHVFRDAWRMVGDREELLERAAPYFRPQGGMALLWLEPWDGTDSLDLRNLDPYFIEICRRVRLGHRNGTIAAWTATSSKARIEAKAAQGNLGDFWTAVGVKDNKALSVSANGFSYRRLSELLFDPSKWLQPSAMHIDRSDDGEWVVVARAVAGGQGKTGGYHDRTNIRFSPGVARLLPRKEGREQLGELAKGLIEEVAAVSNALRFAIATAASGGKAPGEIDKADRVHATPFVRHLDDAADVRFFSALQRRFLAADDGARRAERADFVRPLIGVARALLQEAIEAVPCPAILRHRARAKALAAFDRDLAKPSSVLANQPEVRQSREEREGIDHHG